MLRSCPRLCAVAVLLIVGCRLQNTPDTPTTPTTAPHSGITETPLAHWPEQDPRLPGATVSPDGLHVAWIVRRGFGETLVLDGKSGRQWDEIGGVLEAHGCIASHVCGKFSDDSQHFVYWGRKGRLWHLVQDGRPGRGCPGDQRSAPHPVGPVNGHCAVRVQRRGEAYWIVDGQEQPHYTSLYGQLQFSPDGLHYAYGAGTRLGTIIVRDGRTITLNSSWGPPSNFAFSPDGERLAYVTQTSVPPHGNTTAPLIVVDGKTSWVGHPFTEVYTLAFSPDSSSLAWVETSHTGKVNKTWVFSGNEYAPSYDRLDYLSFGPEGRSLMFVGYRSGGEAELVSNGHVMARADDFAPVRPTRGEGLAPLRIATDAFTCGTTEYPVYLVKRKGLWQVEPGGMEPARRAIAQVTSPLTFFALRRDTKWILISGGLERAPAFDAPLGPPVHSPELGRTAYAVRLGDLRSPTGAARIVVDGKAGPPAWMVSQPAFSADGQHVAYFARSRQQAWAVVDSVDGPRYDSVLGQRQRSPVFDSEGLTYLAVRDNTLYRVAHRFK